MSTFSEKAKSFSGVVASVDKKTLVIEGDDGLQTFCVEGAALEDIKPGHEVTIITWDNTSAVRVVDHATNTIYRPYYNPDPDDSTHLAEGNRSPADVIEGRIGLMSLLPAVFLATIFQSIPVYGWYVTYKMIVDADNSITGTAPQYAAQARVKFVVSVALAFVMSGYVFLSAGDVLKAVLTYMTVLYVGTFLLMRTIFIGIEEIDHFMRTRIG